MAARNDTSRSWRLGQLDALCLVGFGVLLGLALSEWWPTDPAGREVAAACERLVAASGASR